MAKYDALRNFLAISSEKEIKLTFSEIENILGFRLPNSAYIYPAWWANNGHSHADSWAKAGYITTELNIQKQCVVFSASQSRLTNSSVLQPIRCAATSVPKSSNNCTVSVNTESNYMQVCGYAFQYVQHLIPVCENGRVKEYYPQHFYDNKNHLPLLSNGSGSFCRFSITAPAVAGVYLWVVDSEIIYIGETLNLQQRFNTGYGNISPRNCYLGGQSTNCKMNKVVMEYFKQGKPVALYFHQTNNYKQIELQLLNRFRTKYNVKDN